MLLGIFMHYLPSAQSPPTRHMRRKILICLRWASGQGEHSSMEVCAKSTFPRQCWDNSLKNATTTKDIYNPVKCNKMKVTNTMTLQIMFSLWVSESVHPNYKYNKKKKDIQPQPTPSQLVLCPADKSGKNFWYQNHKHFKHKSPPPPTLPLFPFLKCSLNTNFEIQILENIGVNFKFFIKIKRYAYSFTLLPYYS